jgi:hypothetical protein
MRKYVIILVLFFLVSALPSYRVSAEATTLTVTTSLGSYEGASTIYVSGLVSPTPVVSGNYVALTIKNYGGSIVDANEFLVTPNTGAYSGTFVTGGPTYAQSGLYTITASYGGTSASANFIYYDGTGPYVSLTANPSYCGSEVFHFTGRVSAPLLKDGKQSPTLLAVLINPSGLVPGQKNIRYNHKTGTFSGSFLLGGTLADIPGNYFLSIDNVFNGITWVGQIHFSYSVTC